MTKHLWTLSLLGGSLISFNSQAEALWSDFSLSYLHGEDYEVGDPDREVLTVEHASAYTWGDNFFFLDHEKHSDGTTSNYFELSPRVSLSNLSGKNLSIGIIKDIYLASTWEGSDNFDNYLYGIGFSLNLPGFQYFDVNAYIAKNDLADDDEQLTLAWGLPFAKHFLYDGFIDYSTESDTSAAEMNFTSQLKWNAGSVFNLKTPFYIGLEYAYWNNKFGIDGVDERNPSLLIKWHL